MENQPGYVKDNPMTRLADEVKRANSERGMPAGRTAGVPMVGGPAVRVSSAAMLAPPTPLPIEQQRELDQRAREIGILPPDENDEEAGFPPREDIEIPVGPLTAKEQYDRDFPPGERLTAREFVGRHGNVDAMRTLFKGLDTQFAVPEKPINSKLIDFKKVQGIDLIHGLAYVDSFDIELPPEDIAKFKKYVIDLAVDYVTKKLAEALAELKAEEPVEDVPTPIEVGDIKDGSNSEDVE